MAEAVIRGAENESVEAVDVRARQALTATVEDVLWADAFILGTPENFGYMSGAMKHFLDTIYYPCENKISGRAFALFVRAGNDGSGAISSIRRILTGLAVKEVQEPLIAVGELTDEMLDACETLGMYLAAGLEGGIF